MRMDRAMTGVDHEPFVIRLVNQASKQRSPNPLAPPADKPAMRMAPPSVVRWHIAPVLKIQKTALMNRRLSSAMPPYAPLRPGRWGSSKAQVASEISWRRWTGVGCFIQTSFAGLPTRSHLPSRDYTI